MEPPLKAAASPDPAKLSLDFAGERTAGFPPLIRTLTCVEAHALPMRQLLGCLLGFCSHVGFQSSNGGGVCFFTLI